MSPFVPLVGMTERIWTGVEEDCDVNRGREGIASNSDADRLVGDDYMGLFKEVFSH